MQLNAHRCQLGQVRQVGRVVDEGADMQRVAARQMLQQVEGADLVALVRRKGQPMGEEEQRLHAGQPRLRTMKGPIVFAKLRGMRRQTSIISLYFGFDGLLRGRLSRLYRQYS